MKIKLEEMKNLVAQLNIYRDSYYNRQDSIVSDHEYDDMFDSLVHLEAETGVVLSNSPTATVGYEVKSKLTKVKHSHPMLSLDKTKSEDDLIYFAGDKDCILSCKMDGLTVLLTYEGGHLVQAETRGNGEEGEIITHNAKVFDNIPLAIPYEGRFEIEGEAIITYDCFNAINSNLPEGVEPYKNPRNLVSGSVRQLDSKIAKDRHIKFIAWKVPTPFIEHSNSFVNRLLNARELGFETVPMVGGVDVASKDKLPGYIEDLKEQAKKKGYPIDGLVLTYDDIAYGESLGMTGHHPKHSIAFKFYDDEYESKLLDIEFSMGKTGVLSPVAIFEPVEIDGTIVQRASLSNLSVMQETIDIPYKGQPIWITKRNQIIPKIERAVKRKYKDIKDIMIHIPKECPICGSKTRQVKEKDTLVLECINPDCKGKLLGKLVHFCSKSGVNIDGLSESTLEKFIELGWISCFEDIYKLDEYASDMVWLDGFGKKSVLKLLDSIEKSKTITLDKFICALSIPLIGRTASKAIAEHFNYDIDDFLFACDNMIDYDFTKIEGFGETMAKSIVDYTDNHFYEISTLVDHFTFTKPETTSTSTSLSGLTFVITGSVNKFANRDEVKAKIEALGGKVSGSVSKNTNFLVNNDVNSTSSKNKKAKELGVKIITEDELIKMMN